MVTINYRDGRPIYEQVKDDLRRLVVTGAMQPGKSSPRCASLRYRSPSTRTRSNVPTTSWRARDTSSPSPAKAASRAQFSPQSDPRREELLARLEETVRELRWLGVSEEEIIEKIGGDGHGEH